MESSSDEEASIDNLCRLVGIRETKRTRSLISQSVEMRIETMPLAFMMEDGTIVNASTSPTTESLPSNTKPTVCETSSIQEEIELPVSISNEPSQYATIFTITPTGQMIQEQLSQDQSVFPTEMTPKQQSGSSGSENPSPHHTIQQQTMSSVTPMMQLNPQQETTDTCNSSKDLLTDQLNADLLVNEPIENSSHLCMADRRFPQTEVDILLTNTAEEEYGNVSGNRKRKSKGLADSTKWTKEINKKNRMEGKQYKGYRREQKPNSTDWKPVNDVEREERKMGPVCTSNMCTKSKFRSCQSMSEEERSIIFKKFWEEMTWQQKRQYLCSLVEHVEKKQIKQSENSRRTDVRCYFLINKEGQRVQVCQKLFLSTFGIKEWTLRYWLDKTEHGMIQKPEITHKQPEKSHKQGDIDFLKAFLGELVKMPSHYCRSNTTRLYLEPIISSKSKLYELYEKRCHDSSKIQLSRWAFDKEFAKQNLSLYHPKKDQCDICCEYRAKNITEAVWKLHIEKKNLARREKEADKVIAESGLAHVYTQDVQAVKLCPYLEASALYFKLKLCVHNFTTYNLGTKDASCYWFDEVNAGLEASVYVSCIIDCLSKALQKKILPIILYSDGSTAQNRNVVLSNALLDLAIRYKTIIIQKFLERGHTQMECDSVHSAIECKLRQKEIYLPSQYATICKEARPKQPYETMMLHYSFFDDYSDKTTFMYDSIRPGRHVNDPTVTDLRALQYNPNGMISYKISFADEFQPLPRRAKQRNEKPKEKLYKEPLKITQAKWKNLQELKRVIPADCHAFYDQLPHN